MRVTHARTHAHTKLDHYCRLTSAKKSPTHRHTKTKNTDEKNGTNARNRDQNETNNARKRTSALIVSARGSNQITAAGFAVVAVVVVLAGGLRVTAGGKVTKQ